MLNIGKILKLIYRDVDMEKILNGISDMNANEDIRINKNIDQIYNYNLDNYCFKDLIVKKYCKLHPGRYSEDEILHILEIYKQNLVKKTSKNSIVQEQTYNTLSLFSLTSEHFLEYKRDQIFVSFDKLLEWDDVINSIDVNVLIASYEAKLQTNMIHESNVIKHDNWRLYNKLKSGFGDTHMHLQASGYSTDINWFRYNEILISQTKLKNGKENLNFFSYKLNGQEIIDEKHLLVQMKLKFIRLFLYEKIRSSEYYKSRGNSYSDENIISISDLKKVLLIQSSVLFKDYEQKESIVKSFIDADFNSLEFNSFNYVLFERNILVALFKMYYSNQLNALEILVFNIYISGLNIFKFELTQDNTGMGFTKFKEYEQRKKMFIDKSTDLSLLESVFDKYYREGSVKFIELRIAPKDKMGLIKLIDEIDQINELVYIRTRKKNSQICKIEYGIIIHYIKDKSEIQLESKFSRKDNFVKDLSKESTKLTIFFEMRNYNVFENEELNSTIVLRPINRFIHSLEAKSSDFFRSDYKSKIIGIDAANHEINCRPENFGSIFRKHKSELGNKSIGVTFHVGESFITLANGLRAIDEAIEYLDMNRGDRLGHAIALGINVDDYFNVKKNQLFSSLQDHLDDLAWMYKMILSTSNEDRFHIVYLYNEIEKYIQILYNNISCKPTVPQYISSMTLRGDCPYIYILDSNDLLEQNFEDYKRKFTYRMNFNRSNYESDFNNLDARKIYLQYHFDEDIKTNGQAKLCLNISKIYLSIIKECQNILKNKILESGISVEVNPSSNKKISYASKFNQIQLLNLNSNSLIKDECLIINSKNIPVTINTDDSAVFQTDLSNEYSLIASFLIKDGYNVESVYNYIDYLRNSSNELTFLNLK